MYEFDKAILDEDFITCSKQMLLMDKIKKVEIEIKEQYPKFRF